MMKVKMVMSIVMIMIVDLFGRRLMITVVTMSEHAGRDNDDAGC